MADQAEPGTTMFDRWANQEEVGWEAQEAGTGIILDKPGRVSKLPPGPLRDFYENPPAPYADTDR